MFDTAQGWFDIWPSGGGYGGPNEHVLDHVTLVPAKIGARALGRCDAYLSDERRHHRATGQTQPGVVFDATVWSDDGELLWYGDVDAQAAHGRLQTLADAIAMPVHLNARFSRPCRHDDRLYWCAGAPILSVDPTTDRCHPWAPLRRIRLPRSWTICYAHSISKEPVDWHPIGAALTPTCFMRFGDAVESSGVTPAELNAGERHPHLARAVRDLAESTLVAIEDAGLVLEDRSVSLPEVIHAYVGQAIAQVAHEPPVADAWARVGRASTTPVPKPYPGCSVARWRRGERKSA
jgi:hypothetical protein